MKGVALRSGLPKTNLYYVLDNLVHCQVPSTGGPTSEVIFFNLPKIENKNLRDRDRT
jgi:hypothetical protein